MIIRDDRQNFIAVFLEKNKQLNLSAIRDPEGVFLKHVCDALQITKALQAIQDDLLENENSTISLWKWENNATQNNEKPQFWLLQKWQRVIDVGTWWGIPLLPLASIYPEVNFTGLDSVRKKTVAVADMADQLWLQNVHVIWSRAEEYKPAEQFDVLTARAVAFSSELFKRTYTLVKKWWYFVLYKMFSEEEESRLDSYVMQRKMTMLRKHYYKLFDDDIQRVIYIIQK